MAHAIFVAILYAHTNSAQYAAAAYDAQLNGCQSLYKKQKKKTVFRQT